MRRLLAIATALVLGATPAVAHGQKPNLPRASAPRVRPRGTKDTPRRAQLERRFRERGEQIVRRRLHLSDGQMQKLRDVNARFDGRRRALVQQQRTIQLDLRDELARGSAANQGHVSQLNAQLDGLKRQRFELQQQEQREMSRFLTPVQQAQYAGLQAQLRRKVQELRSQSAPGRTAPQTP